MDLFRFIPGYRAVIYDEGKEPLFLLFLAFLIAFACARGYTRLARKRGWGSASVGGVHLHHIVIGIVLLLTAGLVAFTRAGAKPVVRDLCAIAFGIGAALVLDEFALVFYLRDVYWSQQGRESVDATILGVMAAGLCLVVSEPFGLDEPTEHLGRLVFFSVVAANIVFAAVSFLKAKPFAGTAAVLVPMLGWLGAFRLAKPHSPWARWFYRAAKLNRAERRLERGFAARFQQRLLNLVGGEPSSP